MPTDDCPLLTDYFAPMLYAIFSDVHGNTRDLERALRALEDRGVESYLQLGDLGAQPLPLLEGLQVQHVFGNWEVSGLPHIPSAHRQQVAAWPASISGPDWIATHATPAFPAECSSTAATRRYMAAHQPRWLQLFPSLLHDERAIWTAFAALAEQGRRVCFHGHTHVQAVQQLDGDNRLRRLHGPVVELSDGALTLVGVGALGAPRDGPHPRCVLFDPAAGRIELLAIP